MKKQNIIVYAILVLIFLSQSSFSFMSLDKTHYLENEAVKINLSDPSNDISLTIKSGSNTYRFFTLPNILYFMPKDIGSHIIELQNESTQALIETLQFNVIGGQAQESKKKKIQVQNSKGKDIKGNLRIYSSNNLVAIKSIADMEIDSSFENKTYDIEMTPETKNINSIRFRNIKFKESFELGVEDINYKGFAKSFAIDPSRLEFDYAIVTSIAMAKSLYKCEDWNFTKQECYGGWKKIKDIVPGEEYSFLLTAKDPGFGESDTPPEPHPVRGFVYHANNITRAENGIPVRIIDRNTSESVLTQVFAPPLPQFAGAYLANLLGNDQDSIIVMAWNSTHFGETNATLLSTTTNVNVTMNMQRGSEANVTILYPQNHTSFGVDSSFNVTANIMILASNGVNCRATVSLSNTIASLFSGEQQTFSIGNINAGSSILVSWNFTASSDGAMNITVNASCDTDITILENLNVKKAENITVIDNINPEITLVSPLDNEEVTNPFQIIFNASDHTGLLNCSFFVESQLNQTIFNLQMFIQHKFNLTGDAGRYRWFIECYDNSTLENYNRSETRRFVIPTWHFYYGNLSTQIELANSGNNSKFTWNDTIASNIYAVETGSNIDWVSLQALGRDINNLSAFDDFSEADINLSMQAFTDSINNTYTLNNQVRQPIDRVIYNRLIRNIPAANSTNTTNFFTGILWDTTDGNTEYNSSQDLVFITERNLSLSGKFGTYNYELRVPATLANYKIGSGTISFYIEIK